MSKATSKEQSGTLSLPIKVGILLYVFLATTVIAVGWNASRAIPLSLVRRIYPRATSNRAPPSVASLALAGRPEVALQQEEVSFVSRLSKPGPSRLRGTLCRPSGPAKKRPAALLIHGSGAQTRDGVLRGDLLRPQRRAPFALLQTLAEFLCREGFVVLRYDKRSCENCYPGAGFSMPRFRFDDYQRDAEDGLAYLRSLDGVDADKILLVAHSQGAKIAVPIAAKQSSVQALLLLAPAFKPVADGALDQLLRVADLRRAMADWLGYFRLLREHKRHRRCFEQLVADSASNANCLGKGIGLQSLKEERIQAERTMDMLFKSPVPTLVVHGSLDLNVDVEFQVVRMQKEARSTLQLRWAQDAGHLLNRLPEGGEPSGETHSGRLHSAVPAWSRDFLSRIPAFAE